MEDRSHLPVAAGLPDMNGLEGVADLSLSGMADECARWLHDTSECQASIVTPAAKTLWAVLFQDEVDHVARTHDRLLDEIASRMDCADEVA